MIYKLLMPYLSLVEPHFDNVMGRARDVTRDSVNQARNRAIQYVSERKDDVVGIVRRCAVLALVSRRQVSAIAPTVASPVSGSLCAHFPPGFLQATQTITNVMRLRADAAPPAGGPSSTPAAAATAPAATAPAATAPPGVHYNNNEWKAE